MGFIKPIEQYLFGNLLTKIHVFMYLKDIIRGGNSMKNYQTLIGFVLVAIAIIIAAVIISSALNDCASLIRSGLSFLADNVRG